MAKEQGISLAFLDTLSCSLGALMLIFFIFAALTHEGMREIARPSEMDALVVAKTKSRSQGEIFLSARPALFMVSFKGQSNCEPLIWYREFFGQWSETAASEHTPTGRTGDSRQLVLHVFEGLNEPIDLDLGNCDKTYEIRIDPIQSIGMQEPLVFRPAAASLKLRYDPVDQAIKL